MFRRFTREVAEAQASDADELLTRLQAVRNHWLHGQDPDVDALLRFLEAAPEDDEPLTPEEAAMLDARLSALASGSEPTFSHEEVGRMLDEVRDAGVQQRRGAVVAVFPLRDPEGD